jgi:hypothetical protein
MSSREPPSTAKGASASKMERTPVVASPKSAEATNVRPTWNHGPRKKTRSPMPRTIRYVAMVRNVCTLMGSPQKPSLR